MPRSTVTVRTKQPDWTPSVLVTPRIGITKAADWPLRFLVDGSPWTSRKADRGAGQAGAD
jgi:3-methyladenine DNA glycosylase Mpg